MLDFYNMPETTMLSGKSFVLMALLVSFRLLPILLMTPVFYATVLPRLVRVWLVVVICVLVTMGLYEHNQLQHGFISGEGVINWPHVLVAAHTELALGLFMGMSMLFTFAAFSYAGGVLDGQIGLSIAQTIDPLTQRNTTILSSALEQVSIVVFLLVDGHHALIRGLYYSYQHVPIGGHFATGSALELVVNGFMDHMVLGFLFAAPVSIIILLIEFLLGVIVRNLPQINMFVLGIPIKIMVALVVMYLLFQTGAVSMQNIYEHFFSMWDAFYADHALK